MSAFEHQPPGVTMSTITLEEARDQLREAEAHYREIEKELAETAPGTPTAERVVRNVELQGQLHDAAQQLIKARDTHKQVEKQALDKRRARGYVQLAKVEEELVTVVEKAEADMAKLKTTIGRVLDLSKQRYAYRQEATGRASRSLLARNAAHGWLHWHMSSLELPGMDHAPKHYRAPLIELLGLDSRQDEATTGDNE